MIHGNTDRNWETAQRLTIHYDQFIHIVSLKKAKNKRTFFCFRAPSGNLHE